VHIICIIDATFVPNLAFLGLLSPDISFGEKTVTHPDTHTPTHTDTQLTLISVNLSAENKGFRANPKLSILMNI